MEVSYSLSDVRFVWGFFSHSSMSQKQIPKSTPLDKLFDSGTVQLHSDDACTEMYTDFVMFNSTLKRLRTEGICRALASRRFDLAQSRFCSLSEYHFNINFIFLFLEKFPCRFTFCRGHSCPRDQFLRLSLQSALEYSLPEGAKAITFRNLL